MLKKLQCENCGAPLNHNLKCEYCGTQYERKGTGSLMHYVQTCPAKIQALKTEVRVANEMLRAIPSERVAEYSTRELIRNLTDALTPYIKLQTEFDPMTMTQIIRGSIRVVEPDFRF